jgi:DNA-binding NarL/FixJ family response regulator
MVTSKALAAASSGRALINVVTMIAGRGPIRSVVVCDDRPTVLGGMSDMLRPLPDLIEIAWVTEGFELLDVVESRPVDLVLVGVHGASTVGAEAVSLLLGMHASSVVVVFGSVAEIDLLAAAYIRGAQGLLTWDPDQPDVGAAQVSDRGAGWRSVVDGGWP